MTLRQEKIDVTDRIVGKLHGNQIDLYLENEKIGSVKVPSDQSQFELSSQFQVFNQKIFKDYSVVQQPDAKYTDCDQEGGWC